MPFDVNETTLPGVGKKYEIYLDESRSIAVLIESGGERQVLFRETPADDYEKVLELTDSQARTLGLFLVGAYYQPIAAEVPEETESGEHIEWYSVTTDSQLVGQRFDEVEIEEKTGVTVLGIEHDMEVISTVSDDFVFEAGDRLIAIGTEEAHTEMEGVLQQ